MEGYLLLGRDLNLYNLNICRSDRFHDREDVHLPLVVVVGLDHVAVTIILLPL
ncbi:unnamed protein product [Brassica oleracea]